MQEFEATLSGLAGAKQRRTYPRRDDARCDGATLWPQFIPRFGLRFDAGTSVFTIGSCFARNIEEALLPLGVTLPTQDFAVPRAEWVGRANGMLNEYNPGTMAQRVLHALSGTPSTDATLAPCNEGVLDLLLPGQTPVTPERAAERRAQIAGVYARLARSSAVIMTLGLVECWYDTQAELFLNRMPPAAFARAQPGRYMFRRLTVQESVDLLAPALAALEDLGIRVVLTVSPVPMQSTFTADDCLVANEFSKAVLRVAADQLRGRFAHVDYYPSYEIVRSGGLPGYKPDNVHVQEALVEQITSRMVAAYAQAAG